MLELLALRTQEDVRWKTLAQGARATRHFRSSLESGQGQSAPRPTAYREDLQHSSRIARALGLRERHFLYLVRLSRVQVEDRRSCTAECEGEVQQRVRP